MAATSIARELAGPTRHLTVVRPAAAARRDLAVSRARDARRKLEARQAQAGDRFAYLRRTHD